MTKNTGNENKVKVKTENTNTGANDAGGELPVFNKFLQGETHFFEDEYTEDEFDRARAEFDCALAEVLKHQREQVRNKRGS